MAKGKDEKETTPLSPFKSSEKMTAERFAGLKGFSSVDHMAVKMLYKKEEKAFVVWEKELAKDFVFNK